MGRKAMTKAATGAGRGRFDPGRRALIKAAAGAGVLLAAPFSPAATSAARAAPAARAGLLFLATGDALVVRRIAPVILAGALPAATSAAHEEAVDEVVGGVDRTIAHMSAAVQAELRQLFDLLSFMPTRIVLAACGAHGRRPRRPRSRPSWRAGGAAVWRSCAAPTRRCTT